MRVQKIFYKNDNNLKIFSKNPKQDINIEVIRAARAHNGVID